MDEAVAKQCIKSTLRYESTVSALKEQLAEVTEKLRAKEEENHQLQAALARGEAIVSEDESHDELPINGILLEEKHSDYSQHFTQEASEVIDSSQVVSEPNATSDFSLPSQDITLGSFFSKETTRNNIRPAKADVESCDTKKLCLQKLAQGQDGFIENLDFETLFQRELTEKSVS